MLALLICYDQTYVNCKLLFVLPNKMDQECGMWMPYPYEVATKEDRCTSEPKIFTN